MPAFRGVFRFPAAAAEPTARVRRPPTAGLTGIQPLTVPPGMTPDIAALVAACRDAGGLGGRRLTAAGVLASFKSTAARTVRVWIVEPRPVILPAPAHPLPAGTGGPVVGLISLVTMPRRHAIGWLLVHPEVRRQGVGRALVAAAIDAAHGRAAREIWIEVHPDWSGAWAFWQSVGFRPA